MEKGYAYHHYLHHRSNGSAPHHHQLGQQPFHPGFILPPQYVPREEYSSVKSIDDSRASVYFTPRTNGTQPGGGADGDESMSQKSIQNTPIHINYITEVPEMPEELRMLYHEMQPLAEVRKSQKKASSKNANNTSRVDGHGESFWSERPERLFGGGGDGDEAAAAAEEMMMRMSLRRLENLDEDTSEILLHELIQKKLKRDRRNRMRLYDERKRQRQRRPRAVGGNAIADQGPIDADALIGMVGACGGRGLGKAGGRSRRPVMASAMDPEFLRLLNGGAEGLPIGGDHHHQARWSRINEYKPMQMMVLDEEERVQGRSKCSARNNGQQKRAIGVGVEKADILYHSLEPPQQQQLMRAELESVQGTSSGSGGSVVVTMERKPSKSALNFNPWPRLRNGRLDEENEREEDEEEDEMFIGDRFGQRQMLSKSLPEISKKRGAAVRRRNKEGECRGVEAGRGGSRNGRIGIDCEEGCGDEMALLGGISIGEARSTNQMVMTSAMEEEGAAAEGRKESGGLATNQQQTA